MDARGRAVTWWPRSVVRVVEPDGRLQVILSTWRLCTASFSRTSMFKQINFLSPRDKIWQLCA